MSRRDVLTPAGASPTALSSSPPPASRSRTPRCGSCVRPVARCPSTARCARARPCSTPAAPPTSSPRSRSSRCVGTGRRRDLLLRHRRAARGRGCGPRHRPRHRPGRPRALPHPRRPGPAARPHARRRPRHHRVGAATRRRARVDAAHRVRRRSVHARFLPRRGWPLQNHEHTKALMHGDPQLWNDLCERLAQISGAFLRVQVEAGASAVQLFDLWAAALNQHDPGPELGGAGGRAQAGRTAANDAHVAIDRGGGSSHGSTSVCVHLRLAAPSALRL